MLILSILAWIIISIVVFSIIVLVHEYGHFKTARIFGVKVEEFWLGIPPKARKLFTDKNGTEYTLNWLPIWGFVRLKWENIQTFQIFDEKKQLYNNATLEKAILEKKDIFDRDWQKISENIAEEILKKLQENVSKDSLLTKPYYQQAIIVLAGVVMNFLLASLIFAVLFFIGVSPIGINNKIETSLPLKIIPTQEQAIKEWILTKNPGIVLYPLEWSFAEKTWFQEWDILYEIYTCESKMLPYVFCEWWEEATAHIINNFSELQNILKNYKWKEIAFYSNAVIHENWEQTGWTIRGWVIPEDGKIWAYISENIEVNRDFEYKYWIIDSLKYWVVETYSQAMLTFKWLKILLQKIFAPNTPTERQEAIEQVSGPIGIVDFMTQSYKNGIIFILIIGAIISINLWVFNLLPIPALDGWRFVFIVINGTIQRIFWKKAINEKLEWIIHVMFFLFLIALSILIAYNDVVKIITRD